MKTAIIGGGGRVGSCAAFALQCSGIVREILILDANQAPAAGQGADLRAVPRLRGNQPIRAAN